MSEKPREKKKYLKPELIQVELRPEEAVLGDCKSPNAGGPNIGGNCAVPQCNSLGS